MLGAGLALLVIYSALSYINDPRGTLSTDVGGKIATIEAMADGGTIDPDVGYWAARWDPSAELHGLYYTKEIDGKYVNVTTLPMVIAARPLYDLGGLRLALLWSMVGGVGAACAARALARRSGASERRSWAAFWLIGLASPVAIYALDLWEHAAGVALMAWGVVAMVDAVDRPRWWRAALAGAAFGAAFSMRTEAAAYAFAVVGVGCVVLIRRSSWWTAVRQGACALAGFLVLALANVLLEVAVIGSSLRAGRASGTASAGGSDVATRVKEALTTTVGLVPDIAPAQALTGLSAVVLLALAVGRSLRGDRGPVVVGCVVGACCLFAVRLVDGLGFVPGFMVAAPFAVAGLVGVLDRDRVAAPGRLAGSMVVVALPVVWYFQYSGGAGPQWGGRYVLTSAVVLAAVGVGVSARTDRLVQGALVGLSVAVTAFGLAWMSYRTHEVADAAVAIRSRPEPVVVSTSAFWLRELGAEYPGSRWLSTSSQEELDRAAGIVEEAGFEELALVWTSSDPDRSPPQVDGWVAVGTDREDWLDVGFRITTYERAT